MREPWLFAVLVLSLFAVLVIAIPAFPAQLEVPIWGLRDFGTLLFLLLHLGTPLLAFVYLKRREGS